MLTFRIFLDDFQVDGFVHSIPYLTFPLRKVSQHFRLPAKTLITFAPDFFPVPIEQLGGNAFGVSAYAHSIPKKGVCSKVIKAVEFKHNGVNAVSERQFEAHYKLYKGYVDKVDEITQKLESPDNGAKNANAIYSFYRGLKEAESFALDGCILHELYFENIGSSQSKPLEKTEKIIKKQFGTHQNFIEDLYACCMAARGWCVFLYEHRTETFRNILLDAHNMGNITLGYPLLVIDMYEHAYFLDYLTDKTKYIKAVIDDINWDVVERRVEYLFAGK